MKATLRDQRLVPPDHPIPRRVCVLGGGGKTTLARAISEKHGLRHIELDALFWLPNWGESTTEEFRLKLAQALQSSTNGWVVDGSYMDRVGDLYLNPAELLIVIAMPWRVMFWRILLRSFRRARDKNLICGENVESWGRMLSREALWWYHVTHVRQYQTRAARILKNAPPKVPVVLLESPRALNDFYARQKLPLPVRH